jgi:hypothetical protein
MLLRCLATSRQQSESVKTNERSSDDVRVRATTQNAITEGLSKLQLVANLVIAN